MPQWLLRLQKIFIYYLLSPFIVLRCYRGITKNGELSKNR